MMEKTVELLTLLYELSLTNIKHQNPKSAAQNFIKKFLARKSLRYGAVWQIESKNERLIHLRRYYSMPEVRDNAFMDTPEVEKLMGKDQLIEVDHSLIHDSGLEGHFIYVDLGDFGYLEFYDADNSLEKASFYPFLDVFNQFAINLEKSMAYENLQKEIKWRKVAEQSLKANEEKYRRIIDNIKLGLLEVNNEDIIQYANKPFLELTGYRLGELLGKRASMVFIDQNDEASRALIENRNALRREGKSDSYEIKMLNKEGEERWAIVSGAPNYDRFGELIGSIGIHLDITEEKLLRQENEFKSAQIKKLFEKSLDALISIDHEGKVFEWSAQAEIMFGFTQQEIIGKSLSKTIIPHSFREAHNQGMDNFHKTGHGPVLNNRIEITALRKSGEEFPVELTIFSLQFKDEVYFTAFVRDITEIKKSKESLQRSLERQKELNNLKSQFISMTSHELRTPLTTIRSNTELLTYQLKNMEEISREKLLKNIKRVDNNVERLNNLINNILMIGKLDSQKVPFAPQHLDLQSFINKHILQDFYQRGYEIPLNIEGEPFEPMIDKNLLIQILNNLIENAIKYSPDAPCPELIVNYKSDHLTLSVKDYGMGIPEVDQSKLFDKFFRASNVGNIQGTGLGLAIVSEYVKLHEGSIDVKSEVGKGTVFNITFPNSVHYSVVES